MSKYDKHERDVLLDRGGYSQVYLTKLATGESVVKKIVYLDSTPNSEISTTTSEQLDNEIAALERLSGKHPNIVKLINVTHKPNDDQVELILEYCNGGNLDYVINYNCSLASSGNSGSIGTDTEKQIEEISKYYLTRIKDALLFMHRNGYVHRDIKPENILLKRIEFISGIFSFTPKLADFGFACKTSLGQKFYDEFYSFYYIAPEMLAMKMMRPAYMEKKGFSQKTKRLIRDKVRSFHFEKDTATFYTYKVDVWSFGIVAYELLYGRVLFLNTEIGKAYRSNEYAGGKKQYNSTDLLLSLENVQIDDYSSRCRNLLSNCLKCNPCERFSWERVNTDEWFLPSNTNLEVPSFKKLSRIEPIAHSKYLPTTGYEMY